MGLSYFAQIVYGVRETKAMRKARSKTHMVERPVCPNGHKIDRWRPPTFCSDCGTKVEVHLVEESYTENPEVAYRAKGLDPENNDRDYDFMANTWIHQEAANHSDGGVVIGICLSHKWVRDDNGVEAITEPTDEQKKELEEYLCDMEADVLGMGEGIKTYMIVGCL